MRYSERELSLQWGKTTVFDRHEIRLRVRVSSLAIRLGSLSYDDIVQAVQNAIQKPQESRAKVSGGRSAAEFHNFTESDRSTVIAISPHLPSNLPLGDFHNPATLGWEHTPILTTIAMPLVYTHVCAKLSTVYLRLRFCCGLFKWSD